MRIIRTVEDKYELVSESEADSKFLKTICFAINMWKKEIFIPKELAHYKLEEICELNQLRHQIEHFDEQT